MTELKVLIYVGEINTNLMGPAMTQYVILYPQAYKGIDIPSESHSNPDSSPQSTLLHAILPPTRTSQPRSRFSSSSL